VDFSAISPLWLISIGLILIGLEIVSGTMFALWFGVATVGVGVLSYFFEFPTLFHQITIVSIVTLIGFFYFAKRKEKLEEKEKSSFGTIQGDKVSFEGTLWSYRSEDNFSDGDEVIVLSKDGNTLSIKKGE
jgi:membrane protein implicated in regulation of membrane protease activity